MDPALGGGEREQLLAVLLRMLSPGTAPPASPPAGTDHSSAVTASEARALTELLAAHGIAQGQLAALPGLGKSTVSKLAAGLQDKGWIARGRDGPQHPCVRLHL